MKGVISNVTSRPSNWGPMYSFQINGSKDFFGVGKNPPPAVGTYVSFDSEKNEKGFTVAKNLQIQTAEPVQTGVNVIPQQTQTFDPKDNYWRRKEERDVKNEEAKQKTQSVIELQSCRNSAIELVKLMITPSTEGKTAVAWPAQAKREEFLVVLVDKYTHDFFLQNRNIENYKKNGTTEPTTSDAPNESGNSNDDGAEWNTQ